MKGKVITRELKRSELAAGSVAVLMLREAAIIDIVTLIHINSDNNWVVEGSDPAQLEVTEGYTLAKLMVDCDLGEYYLKFNQWKKSIRANEVNSNKLVTFDLQPLKFVKGNYTSSCVECEAYFEGSKRQPLCQDCCESKATAKIIINKTNTEKQIPKVIVRERTDTKFIARKSFAMGLEGASQSEFSNWLNKQF